MTITVDLSPEIMDSLQKLSETKQLSITDLVEHAVAQYLVDQEFILTDKPGQVEITAIKSSIAKAEEPGAKWHTTTEIRADIQAIVAGKAITDLEPDKDEADDWQM